MGREGEIQYITRNSLVCACLLKRDIFFSLFPSFFAVEREGWSSFEGQERSGVGMGVQQ